MTLRLEPERGGYTYTGPVLSACKTSSPEWPAWLAHWGARATIMLETVHVYAIAVALPRE